MWNLNTIMKAIELVGTATPAGKAIYDGFVALTTGKDQDDLKARYAAAQARTDDLHQDVQREL